MMYIEFIERCRQNRNQQNQPIIELFNVAIRETTGEPRTHLQKITARMREQRMQQRT